MKSFFLHKFLLEFSSTGDVGVCPDPVVISMGAGKPSIGIPRKGGHVLSWPSDSHLVCGAPVALLEELLEEIEATHFSPGQIRCSVVWQHIDWEPQPCYGFSISWKGESPSSRNE